MKKKIEYPESSHQRHILHVNEHISLPLLNFFGWNPPVGLLNPSEDRDIALTVWPDFTHLLSKTCNLMSKRKVVIKIGSRRILVWQAKTKCETGMQRAYGKEYSTDVFFVPLVGMTKITTIENCFGTPVLRNGINPYACALPLADRAKNHEYQCAEKGSLIGDQVSIAEV